MRLRWLTIWTVVLLASPLTAQQPPPGALALTDVTVIDGTRAPARPGTTILIEDGRIRDVFPSAERRPPPGAARDRAGHRAGGQLPARGVRPAAALTVPGGPAYAAGGASGTPLESARAGQPSYSPLSPTEIMNKGQLVDELARRTGLPRPGAAAVVRTLFDPVSGLIAEELKRGGTVALPLFGSFGTRERPARRGRDPRTGQEIEIPARNVCTFTPRKGLRKSMKDMVGA